MLSDKNLLQKYSNNLQHKIKGTQKALYNYALILAKVAQGQNTNNVYNKIIQMQSNFDNTLANLQDTTLEATFYNATQFSATGEQKLKNNSAYKNLISKFKMVRNNIYIDNHVILNNINTSNITPMKNAFSAQQNKNNIVNSTKLNFTISKDLIKVLNTKVNKINKAQQQKGTQLTILAKRALKQGQKITGSDNSFVSINLGK